MGLRVCTIAKIIRSTHRFVIMIRYANNIVTPKAAVIIIMAMGTAMETEVVVELELEQVVGAVVVAAAEEEVEDVVEEVEEVVVVAKITAPQ